jgi:hypothetical protein
MRSCQRGGLGRGEGNGVEEGGWSLLQTAVTSINSGGAVVSGTSSLAVFWLGFWRGKVCGRKGVYKGAMAWTRGKDCTRFGEESAGITLGTVPCSSWSIRR